MAHVYALDDTALALLADARRLAEDTLARHAQAVDEGARFPKESLEALSKAGLMGLTLPVAAGGKGQGPRTFAAVVEELGMACGSSTMVYVMHVSASMAVASSGTVGGKDALLKELAAGRHLTTLAFSEKGSRSQFWMPVSKLTPAKDGYTTSAYKSWVTSANHAHSYVSSAQRPGASGPLDSTVYLARKGPALRPQAAFDGLGLRGNDSAPVSIEDLAVAEDDLLSAHGGGLKTMLEVVLPWFVVGTAAMSLGLCRRAIAETQKHLTATRFETGGGLRELPQLRARLTEMSVKTEQARQLLAYTTREMEAPNEMTPLWVLQSRLAALDTATEVSDLSMKACGGAAFSKHTPLERVFRDSRAGWIMAPTVDHLKDFVGKALTGLPLF